MIKIFDENETSFITNGLGNLEPLKCLETKRKSLNGWEVEVEVDSRFKELIMQDRIIYVETKEKGGQPFRINNPAYSNHKISFTARHIGFDCERYVLDDVRPTNLPCAAYLNWINDRTDTKSPFSFYSNISKMATSYFVRKTLLEALEEAEEVFDGVYDLNHYEISLKTSVGNDNGFTIIYGKNLQEAKAIEDWSNVCTKVMPVGPDGLLLPEKYILSDIQYPKPYSRVIEFSLDSKKEDETDKTEQELIIELRRMAKNYIENNKYPRVNYTVKSDVNQDLSIGDIIHVKSPAFMINTEVQSYVYNVLTKKVVQLEFGNYTRSVKAVFDGIKDSIENATKETNNLIQHQTDLINRLNKEGLVYIDDNEILFLDKLPKEKAKNVWRFGLGGLGFSSNGYNGPFELAITQDGKINANFIMTGILKAIVVDGVTLKGVTGEIGGWKISGDNLSGTVTQTYNFVQSDLDKVKNYIMKQGTLTDAEKNKYDTDGDGDVTASDYLFIQKVLNKTNPNYSTAKISLKSQDLRQMLVIEIIDGARKGWKTTVGACAAASSSFRSNHLDGDYGSVGLNSIFNDLRGASLNGDEYAGVTSQNTVFLNGTNHVYTNRAIETLSDARKKRAIKDIDISALFNHIKVKEFEYIDGGKKQVGVIAQDFLNTPFEKFVLSQDKKGIYSVDYSVLYLAAIQKVQSLENRVSELERLVKELMIK